MRKEALPADSKLYSKLVFLEKEKWHRRRERMSFTRKIEVLDRLLKMAVELPKLDGTEDEHRRSSGYT